VNSLQALDIGRTGSVPRALRPTNPREVEIMQNVKRRRWVPAEYSIYNCIFRIENAQYIDRNIRNMHFCLVRFLKKTNNSVQKTNNCASLYFPNNKWNDCASQNIPKMMKNYYLTLLNTWTTQMRPPRCFFRVVFCCVINKIKQNLFRFVFFRVVFFVFTGTTTSIWPPRCFFPRCFFAGNECFMEN